MKMLLLGKVGVLVVQALLGLGLLLWIAWTLSS